MVDWSVVICKASVLGHLETATNIADNNNAYKTNNLILTVYPGFGNRQCEWFDTSHGFEYTHRLNDKLIR